MYHVFFIRFLRLHFWVLNAKAESYHSKSWRSFISLKYGDDMFVRVRAQILQPTYPLCDIFANIYLLDH